jgi:hypothetical protein
MRIAAALTTVGILTAVAFSQTVTSIPYIKLNLLPGLIQGPLLASGDRLQKAGLERIVFTGTLMRGTTAAVPVQLTVQFPEQVAFSEQRGATQRSIVFDGSKATFPTDKAPGDEELLESLLNDSTEHFLLNHIKTSSTRILGRAFRLDDGKAKNYTGPYYDIFEVQDTFAVTGTKRVKLYYFNTQTGLLERVRYTMQRGGQPVKVETKITWQKSAGQPVPAAISREENGQGVFSVSVPSAVLSAATAASTSLKP